MDRRTVESSVIAFFVILLFATYCWVQLYHITRKARTGPKVTKTNQRSLFSFNNVLIIAALTAFLIEVLIYLTDGH